MVVVCSCCFLIVYTSTVFPVDSLIKECVPHNLEIHSCMLGVIWDAAQGVPEEEETYVNHLSCAYKSDFSHKSTLNSGLFTGMCVPLDLLKLEQLLNC